MFKKLSTMWCLHDYTHTLSCLEGLISDASLSFFFSHCVLVCRLITVHVLFSLSWSGKVFNVIVESVASSRCRYLAHKVFKQRRSQRCVCKGCSKAFAHSVNSGNMELFGLWAALLSCTCLPVKIPADLLPAGSDIS